MKRSLFEQTFLVLLFLAALTYSSESHAQDLHYSQFYHNPQNINPALTGVFAGDKRIIANYRSQWSSVPVDYLTFSGAYDMKLYHPRLKNNLLGVGAIFNYDRAGDSRLNAAQLGISAAYTHRLAERHFATLGVMGGFTQRAYDPSGLRFNSQFNGDIFSAALPTQEEDLFKNESVFYADFSVGLNYRYQKPKSRTRANLGGALYHVNQPELSFYGNADSNLFSRFSLFGEMTYQLRHKIDILGRVSLQFQNVYKEYVAGIAGRLYLDKDKKLNDVALQLGLAYRFHDFGDALIPSLEILYGPWQVGLSYDVNISAFDIATNGRGGFEVAVLHTIFKARPLDAYRNCIIF